MARDAFAGYDAWLERPYVEAALRAERMECPECGAQMNETRDDGAACPECDHVEDGPEPDEPDPDDMRDEQADRAEDRFDF